jgi:hypothetical protein
MHSALRIPGPRPGPRADRPAGDSALPAWSTWHAQCLNAAAGLCRLIQGPRLSTPRTGPELNETPARPAEYALPVNEVFAVSSPAQNGQFWRHLPCAVRSCPRIALPAALRPVAGSCGGREAGVSGHAELTGRCDARSAVEASDRTRHAREQLGPEPLRDLFSWPPTSASTALLRLPPGRSRRGRRGLPGGLRRCFLLRRRFPLRRRRPRSSRDRLSQRGQVYH